MQKYNIVWLFYATTVWTVTKIWLQSLHIRSYPWNHTADISNRKVTVRQADSVALTRLCGAKVMFPGCASPLWLQCLFSVRNMSKMIVPWQHGPQSAWSEFEARQGGWWHNKSHGNSLKPSNWSVTWCLSTWTCWSTETNIDLLHPLLIAQPMPERL